MANIKTLSAEDSAAWDKWQKAKSRISKLNSAMKPFEKKFKTAVGSSKLVKLSDGRKVRRVEKPRNGYAVASGVTTSYHEEA